jgi:putative transposase
MPRPHRIEFAGARHHVMNRAARREAFLTDDGACVLFLSLVAELDTRFRVRVHGFALMPNHFHLMVESEAGRLADAMRFLTGEFTRRLNGQRGWDGPLFRGRYSNRVVTAEHYWRHLLAYLHLNPVAAHLAPHPGACDWTSHRYYVGDVAAPGWLVMDELLELFGSAAGYAAYVRDVQVGRQRAPDDFDPTDLWEAPVTGRQNVAVHRRDRMATPPVGAVLEEVARVVGMSKADVLRGRRGAAGNPSRWFAAWALVHAAGMTQAEVARTFGVDGAGITRMLHRFEARRGQDDVVGGWVTALLGD